MTKLHNMRTIKERYRPISIRKFPDSLRERMYQIKINTQNSATLETILIEAVNNGLPEIERRTSFKIPDVVFDPEEDYCNE